MLSPSFVAALEGLEFVVDGIIVDCCGGGNDFTSFLSAVLLDRASRADLDIRWPAVFAVVMRDPPFLVVASDVAVLMDDVPWVMSPPFFFCSTASSAVGGEKPSGEARLIRLEDPIRRWSCCWGLCLGRCWTAALCSRSTTKRC